VQAQCVREFRSFDEAVDEFFCKIGKCISVISHYTNATTIFYPLTLTSLRIQFLNGCAEEQKLQKSAVAAEEQAQKRIDKFKEEQARTCIPFERYM
jgi:hypothetical protein